MIWRGVLWEFPSYGPLGASCLAKADPNSLPQAKLGDLQRGDHQAY